MSHHYQLRRSGVSLLELLVVVAIIAVLLGLVLAGAQSARATAARADCANNLRQVGLALHQYHGAHHCFPQGIEPPGTKAEMPYLFWHARLLPHLERQALWQQAVEAYQTDPPKYSNPLHPIRELAIPVFGCPADGRTRESLPGHGGLASYMGVSGTESTRRDGCLFLGSTTRLADVTDGASNTLLAGERPPSPARRYGWWYAGHGQRYNDFAFDAYLGVRDINDVGDPLNEAQDCPAGPHRFQPGRLSDPCAMLHFWSLHPGGAHFLFADGSVRFLAYAADPVMPALATRAGRESVSLPD
jgi:prepilin-type N-terminal cleavage/methylation domain-containing protein/prepilin-type processing-associated H-X9-DG protein